MSAKTFCHPDEIARNPAQPRTYFCPDELAKLGMSMRKKQRQAVTVIPHTDPKNKKVRFMLIDGERRWRAARQEKLGKLWYVIDDEVEGEELHTASFTSNFCRQGHTHAEAAAAIEKEYNSGKTYAEIGALVGKTVAWAANEHSLLKLAPEVLALMDPPTPKSERLTSSIAFLLTKYPAEKQMKLWKQHKSKGSADAFHHIRTAIPTKANRRPSDDVSFIVGRAKSASSICAQLAALPQAMLGRLNAEQRAKIAGSLREAAEKANATAELLTAAIEEDEE